MRQKGDSISFDTPEDAEVSKLPRNELNPIADVSHRLCTCTAKFWTRSQNNRLPMSALTCGKLQRTVSQPPEPCLRLTWKPAKRFEGLYEQQDDNQIEHNLRGKFYTDSNGEYAFYCIKPTPYPVPSDGPSGKLLQLMNRHPFRPAHIHFIVSADFSELLQTLRATLMTRCRRLLRATNRSPRKSSTGGASTLTTIPCLR